MINLSNDQLHIINSPIGVPIQVLASAGSGKTRVLTERVRYIIENTKKECVLALTFTNKAAEEMRDRLGNISLIEERTWISTIHAVAQRILEQYGHTIGLPSELHIYERDQDRKTVFLQSLRESGVDIDSFLDVPDEKTKKDRELIVQRYIEQFSAVKRELLTEDEIKERYVKNKRFLPIFQAYQDSLLESGGIDFDDILVYAHRILLYQPWCAQVYRSKYKHICVDEAQDLNRVQYEFIAALCGEKIKSVMMVGDPNQMIYGFNGSSHKYLCENFVSDFNPHKYVLKKNFRSSKAIIYLANKLKPGSQIEEDLALDGKSQIEELEDETTEALWICDKINGLIRTITHPDIEGDITLGNIVIIARNRFVFKSLEVKLKEYEIPYSLKKGEAQVEPTSIFGKVLDHALRLRLNPKDWVNGKKLCAVLKLEAPKVWGQQDLLLRLASDVLHTNLLFQKVQVNLLTAVQQLDLDCPNIPKICADFKKEIELIKLGAISADNENELERSLQELQDFRDYWTVFKRKGLGESLSSFRNAMALGQLTEDYNPTGLTLSTVHTMKGLEKDIVFLMGMCEGIFPDYRALNNKQQIDEERNNAFVAVTRSRRWIYITYPRKREMPWGSVKTQDVSRFIQEMQIKA